MYRIQKWYRKMNPDFIKINEQGSAEELPGQPMNVWIFFLHCKYRSARAYRIVKLLCINFAKLFGKILCFETVFLLFIKVTLWIVRDTLWKYVVHLLPACQVRSQPEISSGIINSGLFRHSIWIDGVDSVVRGFTIGSQCQFHHILQWVRVKSLCQFLILCR